MLAGGVEWCSPRIRSSRAAISGSAPATTLSPSQPSGRRKSIRQSSASSGTAVETIVRAVSVGSSELSSRRLAATRNSWARRRRTSSVMSRATTEAPISPRSGLRIGETVSETRPCCRRRGSARSRRSPAVHPASPARGSFSPRPCGRGGRGRRCGGRSLPRGCSRRDGRRPGSRW